MTSGRLRSNQHNKTIHVGQNLNVCHCAKLQNEHPFKVVHRTTTSPAVGNY